MLNLTKQAAGSAMRIAADAAGIGDRIKWIVALNPKGIRGKIILQTPCAKNTDINVHLSIRKKCQKPTGNECMKERISIIEI
jgi:hypothetical protein